MFMSYAETLMGLRRLLIEMRCAKCGRKASRLALATSVGDEVVRLSRVMCIE